MSQLTTLHTLLCGLFLTHPRAPLRGLHLTLPPRSVPRQCMLHGRSVQVSASVDNLRFFLCGISGVTTYSPAWQAIKKRFRNIQGINVSRPPFTQPQQGHTTSYPLSYEHTHLTHHAVSPSMACLVQIPTEDGRNKGYVEVRFENVAAAQAAIKDGTSSSSTPSTRKAPACPRHHRPCLLRSVPLGRCSSGSAHRHPGRRHSRRLVPAQARVRVRQGRGEPSSPSIHAHVSISHQQHSMTRVGPEDEAPFFPSHTTMFALTHPRCPPPPLPLHLPACLHVTGQERVGGEPAPGRAGQ